MTTCPYGMMKSRVTWCSTPGQAYYILLSGSNGASGIYQLDFQDGATCPNPVPCPCVAPRETTLHLNATGSLVVHWISPVPGLYHVYSSENPNNDGDPDGGTDVDWVLRSSSAEPTGLSVWHETDSAPLYRNYVVTHRCGP